MLDFSAVGEILTDFTPSRTGSGDSFLADVLRREGGLAAMAEEEIREMPGFANAAGSLVSTKKGAIPALPTEQEALSCMKNAPRLAVRG